MSVDPQPSYEQLATAAGLAGFPTLVDGETDASQSALNPAILPERTHLLWSVATIGANQTSPHRSKIERNHHALSRRVLDGAADYLHFTINFRILFDNNRAGREIRITKHGISFFHALVELARGRPWLPETA